MMQTKIKISRKWLWMAVLAVVMMLPLVIGKAVGATSVSISSGSNQMSYGSGWNTRWYKIDGKYWATCIEPSKTSPAGKSGTVYTLTRDSFPKSNYYWYFVNVLLVTNSSYNAAFYNYFKDNLIDWSSELSGFTSLSGISSLESKIFVAGHVIASGLYTGYWEFISEGQKYSALANKIVDLLNANGLAWEYENYTAKYASAGSGYQKVAWLERSRNKAYVRVRLHETGKTNVLSGGVFNRYGDCITEGCYLRESNITAGTSGWAMVNPGQNCYSETAAPSGYNLTEVWACDNVAIGEFKTIEFYNDPTSTALPEPVGEFSTRSTVTVFDKDGNRFTNLNNNLNYAATKFGDWSTAADFRIDVKGGTQVAPAFNHYIRYQNMDGNGDGQAPASTSSLSSTTTNVRTCIKSSSEITGTPTTWSTECNSLFRKDPKFTDKIFKPSEVSYSRDGTAFVSGITGLTFGDSDGLLTLPNETAHYKICESVRTTPWIYYSNGTDWSTGGSLVTKACITINVTADVGFEGQATGANDTGYSYVSTGWKQETTTTETLEINCDGGSCTGKFKLGLRAVADSGNTPYTILKNVNGGSDIEVERDSFYASSGEKGFNYSETMNAGDTICYSVRFKPNGSSDSTVTRLKACIKAKANIFEGQASVTSDGNTKSTGFTRVSKTADMLILENCGSEGCEANFDLKLKSVEGSGMTVFNITKEENGVSTQVKSSPFTASAPNDVGSYPEVLQPGKVICYSVTFYPYGSGDWATAKACAMALGDVEAGLDMKVSKDFLHYGDEVYVKPHDKVYFRAIYDPAPQYAYNLTSGKVKVQGVIGTCTASESKNFGGCVGDLVSTGWKNAFSVYSGSWTGAYNYNRNYTYTAGVTTKRTVNLGEYTVDGDDVGQTLVETAELNQNTNTRTTPGLIGFSNSGDGVEGTIYWQDDASKGIKMPSGSASAKVPYNFKNTTEVTTVDDNFYAGEEVTVNYVVDVNPRENRTLDGTYATVVRGVKKRVKVCIGEEEDTCWQTEPESMSDLNTEGNLAGKQDIGTGGTVIVVPDVPAGTQICVKSAIYPKDSGTDTNLRMDYYDVNNVDSWAESEEKCFRVAKKPSLQVWGGNVYSNGKISTSVANKKHIDLDGMSYSPNADNYTKSYIFGSWGELGVISVGSVAGFASGAGTGYLDGGHDAIFCPNRSTLTFANTCNNAKETGGLGAMTGAMAGAENDKSTILAKFIAGGEYDTPDESGIGIDMKSGDGVKVFYSGENVTISGNITIPNGDNGSGYTTLSSVPKVVIYAEGNININCDVTRIDAVLIAEGEVKTCSNSDDNNARANSQQLVINGAVIANKLVANRTYGAATGINSIIPAEIINYDSTLYLWAEEQADVTESGKVRVTYVKEIAPRL